MNIKGREKNVRALEGRKALDTRFLYLLSKRAKKHVLSSGEPKRHVRGSHGLGKKTVQKSLPSCSSVSYAAQDAGSETGRHRPEELSLLLLSVVSSSVVAVFRAEGNQERACPGVFQVVL